MKSHPNDMKALGDANRCINVLGLLTDAMAMLQSIPGEIGCLIFGNCEVDNGGNDGDDDSEKPEKPDDSNNVIEKPEDADADSDDKEEEDTADEGGD